MLTPVERLQCLGCIDACMPRTGGVPILLIGGCSLGERLEKGRQAALVRRTIDEVY